LETQIIRFVKALRARGVRISLAESADAFRAIDQLGVKVRSTFRLAMRASLVKEQNQLGIFDELFDLFFGGQAGLPMSNLPEDLTDEEAALLADALRQFNLRLRQLLEKLLRGEELTEEELDRLAALTGLDQTDDPRYQNWMSRRMEQALRLPEVQEALQEMLALLQEMGMTPERLEQLRSILQANLTVLREQIRRFSGRRIAENLSDRQQPEEGQALDDRPFSSLTETEMEKLRRQVTRLAAALRTRAALRQRRAKIGQLDAKATFRANIKYAGVPFEIRHRRKRLKPKLVVICDVSTSMRHMSELMLALVYTIQDQISRTHAYAFIDHLEYISPDFESAPPSRAIQGVLQRMPPGYYSTDLGASLQNFADRHLNTLDRRTTLIFVGDGRNNYNNPRLDLFSRLARRSRRTIWLNPEPAYHWGSGDSDMHEYFPLCDRVLKVNTLAELSQAIDSLLV